MKKNTQWFTLMEVLIVIAIIWILAVWASRINFNPQIDKQNSEMFANNVFTSIESIRNNTLLWKWVGTWELLTYPEEWRVSISKEKIGSNTGSINAMYLSGVTSYTVNDFHVDFINQNSQIKELTCKTLEKNTSWNHQNNVDIIFKGNTLTLSGCTSSDSARILEITTEYKWFEKTIKINSTTWLMEKY